MSKLEKLKARLKVRPADFTWGEMVRLLEALGYAERAGDGSRRKFHGPGRPTISLHRPHPGDIVKRYAVREVADLLEKEGLL
jgi:predicted RNA binding protein YcfA (HicA-like mRNA interferase family)